MKEIETIEDFERAPIEIYDIPTASGKPARVVLESNVERVTNTDCIRYAMHKCLEQSGTGLLDLSGFDDYKTEYVRNRAAAFIDHSLRGTMAEELLLGHDDEEDYF